MHDIKQLTDLFAALGANAPERWARSQLEEGIPQLARFIFLRQAWRLVLNDSDVDWIDERRKRVKPSEPGSQMLPAFDRLFEKGIDPSDLTTVVRVMQWELLFRLCYLLDDPGDLESDVRDIHWRLFQVNENEEPMEIIGGLHESVLETDPSGLEMRPEPEKGPRGSSGE